MARERVELLVSTDGNERAIALEYDPRTTVAQLAGALSTRDDVRLWHRRLARALEPDETIASLGLVRADRLSDRPAEAASGHDRAADTRFQLVVAAGPLAGTRVNINEGLHTIGRGSACSIQLKDPLLSREHARVRVSPDRLEIEDAGSTNGTYVGGERITDRISVATGSPIEVGASLVTFERPQRFVRPSPTTTSFNRPPRILEAIPEQRFVVPTPPLEPARPRISPIAAIVPLVLAALAALLWPGESIYGPLLLLTPLIALSALIERLSPRRRGYRIQEETWRSAVDRVARELELTCRDVQRRLLKACPDREVLEERAAELDPSLWERRPQDWDHLLLRAGIGRMRSDVDIVLPNNGSTTLLRDVAAGLDRLTSIEGCPITIPLAETGAVGIFGDRGRVQALVRSFVLQLGVLQSPADCDIAAILGEEEGRAIRWLPHVRETMLGTRGDLLPPPHVLDRCVARLDRAEGRQLIVFVDGRVDVARDRLMRLLIEGPSRGIHVIWIDRERSRLPGRCQRVIEIHPDGLATVEGPHRSTDDFTPECVDEPSLRRVIERLAPLRDAGESGDPDGNVVSLLDDLRIATEQDVESRWSADAGLPFLLGQTLGGPIEMDLAVEGPHVFVAGGARSGKTEFLRSIIAAIAAGVPPERASFVLIDRSGGTAFAAFATLPHVAAIVTGPDHDHDERVLISLDAEARKRRALLAANGVANLHDLRATRPDVSPPALILVVDDPSPSHSEGSFVQRLVHIAGRDLGIYLVVASRSADDPRSEAVRAIANLSIVFRSEERDSVQIIGTPDAAAIPPGDAGVGFVRRGPRDTVRFKAPFPAKPYSQEAIVVDDLDGPERSRSGDELGTLLNLIQSAHRSRGRPTPESPLLPPLPEHLDLADLPEASADGASVPIALHDEPARQLQSPFMLRFDRDGSFFLAGSPGSGKTSTLKTISAAVARSCSPEQVQIFGIDCAGGDLLEIELLPQCGAVFRADDTESIDALFSLLEARASDEGAPRTMVLLDGYESFCSTFEKIDLGRLVDRLTQLLSSGPTNRIHFVVTFERPSRGPTSPATFGTAALTMKDHAAAGRIAIKDGSEAQVAMPVGLTDIAQVACERWPGRSAPAVAPMPSVVAPAAVELLPHHALLGIREDHAPAILDLAATNLLIGGPPGSGRTTALDTIAASITNSTPSARLWLVAPRGGAVPHLWTNVASDEETICDLLELLDSEGDPAAPSFLFVDDADLIGDVPSSILERLLKRSGDGSLHIVAAGETRSLLRAFGGWLGGLRKARSGLLLDAEAAIDGDLLGTRLPRRSGLHFPPGRGYLVERDKTTLIQVALPG